MTTNNNDENKAMATNYNEQLAKKYGSRKNLDTGFIAYRDLPEIIKKYAKGPLAIDYGCGTGFSTQLLFKEGFKAIGADINDNMLNVARMKYPHIEFVNIALSNKIESHSFDLVLCAFVLLEMSSLDEILKTLQKIRNLMKKDASLVMVTTSEHFPKNNWLTARNAVEKNATIKSGDPYRVFDTRNEMYFSDFFYTDDDYRSVLKKAGFNNIVLYNPMGKESDNIKWTTEWTLAPYSVYVCSSSM